MEVQLLLQGEGKSGTADVTSAGCCRAVPTMRDEEVEDEDVEDNDVIGRSAAAPPGAAEEMAVVVWGGGGDII